MNEERWLEIAGAILDGSPVEWEQLPADWTDDDLGSVDGLRLLADLASAHRTADSADWGPLRILEKIGSGTFGDVYRAHDPALERDVALKILRGTANAAASHEGRLLARVRHRNVVTVYGAAQHGGIDGIWTELIDGRTLADIVTRDGPLDGKAVAAIGLDVCHALAAVHASGLLHGDIKAQNVMRENGGRIVLMDFGTGRFAVDPSNTNRLAGTPLYLAPEVLNGQSPDTLADVYGVGVLLYHLLTGTFPVEGRTLEEVRASHAAGERVPIRDRRPDIPRGLAATIARALSPTPSDRFENIHAMAAALTPGERTTVVSVLGWSAVAASIVAVMALGTTTSGRQRLKRMAGGGPPAAGAAATMAAGSMPATRRLEMPKARLSGPGGLSRNGRYFAVSAIGGAPAVFDMTTGEMRELPRPSADGYAEFAIASPDGQSIAYQWWPDRGPCELHVVDRMGRSDRVLVRDDSLDFPVPYDWSHDGSRILVVLAYTDGRRVIALVDVNTGAQQIVHEIRHGEPTGASLSMDGRYVAFDLPDDSQSPRRTIRIVDTIAGGERVLLGGERTNNQFPLWTSDGRSLFFLSDRSGTPDGWVVPALEGSAIGEPQIVARNLGSVTSLGLTDAGTFYYSLQTGQFDVNEVTIDPVSMAVSGKPRAIRSRLHGSNIGPSYSHDGRHLAYISQHTDLGGGLATRFIVIRDLTSGDEREIAPPIELGVLPPKWSPDDRRLIVKGTSRTNQWGAFVVEAATGVVQHQIVWPQKDRSEYGRADWTNDGKAILFAHNARGIVTHPLDGGDERVVLSKGQIPFEGGLNTFGYTRDGERLAFTAWSRQTSLNVVEPNGVVRELVTAEPPHVVNFQAWFPQGDYLLYSRYTGGTHDPHELWRVAVSGGSPQRLGLSINSFTGINTVALSPTGTALAYTSGYIQNQLWMMENFLSK